MSSDKYQKFLLELYHCVVYINLDCYYEFVLCIQVSGEVIAIGTDLEPILSHITYPGGDGDATRELSSGFSKFTTIDQLKVQIG